MSEDGEQPFLSCQECIDFLRSYGRVMFITRGLPGSGKAGIAEAVRGTYPGCKIIYADQMFLGIGAVDKNIETTTEAHLLCQKRTEEALQGNTSVVMYRNNNATVRETARYIELAAKYGYLVIVIDTLQKEDMTVEYLAACNTKLLGTTYISRALDKWEDVYPLCTGWFMKPSDKLYLLRRMALLQKSCKENGLRTSEVYAMPGPSFCLARFCWFGMEESNRAYFDKVKHLIGTTHLLRVYGYTIVNAVIYGLVELDEILKDELASGDAVQFLGTALWKPTSCIVPPDAVPPQTGEAESSNFMPSTHAPMASKHPSFIVLGNTNGISTTPNAPTPKIAEIWENVLQKTAGLPSVRIGDATVQDGNDVCFMLLDDVICFKTIFAGFYQPYVPRYRSCKYFKTEAGCKRGTTCMFDHCR
ncbi:uncharacterized protein LOC142572426 [Dermacentor variabilis]|uniref:uncharacterized protein LOC142572426 n=1 Tax=Dermacentor variabilis TaxID=34621 RepID=UPI003F5B3969